jgi:hypothetical protein
MPSAPLVRAGLDEFLEARDSDFEELVEIRAGDAQKFDALEQRNSPVLGLFQNALIELQERQLAVDIKRGGL